jgi:hypothetical protein
MANEIDRRYGNLGLHATSLHPGSIDTSLARHMDPQMVAAFKADDVLMSKLKSPQQGAAMTLVAAVGREWEDKGGESILKIARKRNRARMMVMLVGKGMSPILTILKRKPNFGRIRWRCLGWKMIFELCSLGLEVAEY